MHIKSQGRSVKGTVLNYESNDFHSNLLIIIIVPKISHMLGEIYHICPYSAVIINFLHIMWLYRCLKVSREMGILTCLLHVTQNFPIF